MGGMAKAGTEQNMGHACIDVPLPPLLPITLRPLLTGRGVGKDSFASAINRASIRALPAGAAEGVVARAAAFQAGQALLRGSCVTHAQAALACLGREACWAGHCSTW